TGVVEPTPVGRAIFGAIPDCRTSSGSASRPGSTAIRQMNTQPLIRVPNRASIRTSGTPRETPRDALSQHEPTPANVRVWATSTVAWYARAFTVASHAEACWDVSVGVCVTAVESRPPGVLGASQSPARRPFGARVMAF